MNGIRHLTGTILSPALVASLAIATTTAVSAADAAATAVPPPSATAQAAQKLDELEEVWVRGKRLSEVIEKAENEFFRLYNKVNKDHDYDVHCGEMLLSRISLAMTRSCMPGFYVYNYLDLAGRAVPSCSTTNTDTVSDTSDYTSDSGRLYYTGCTYAPQVPPELLAMAHREAYRKNVLRIIGSDERLKSMATRLAGLYGEMEAVQTRYVKIKGLDQSGRPVRQERRKPAAAAGRRAL